VAELLKPSVEQLGVDSSALEWQRSGASGAAIEVAFAGGSGASRTAAGDWVLMRTESLDSPVLVFTRFEWECFLDGVKKGEFDDAAS